MLQQPRLYITPEEYLELERQAETKSEYWNGEVYAMAGASEAHNLITTNLIVTLGTQVKGRSCKVYANDMRVKVRATGLYTYPDVIVVCGKAHFEDRYLDTLLNPTVLLEVLSRSTEIYDRVAKFDHYRTLESLSDYLLVAQDNLAIEHYVRQPDDKWLLSIHKDLDTIVHISSIGCELRLADVYDRVEWPETLRILRPARVVKETGAEYLPR
jgi:Uma2 family endonuclease